MAAMVATNGGLAQTKAPAAAAAARVPGVADAVADSRGIKRMAVLRGLDKVTGRAIDINAPAGVPVRFGSLTITARYCYTVPPEQPPETSAFVQIDDTLPNEPAKRLFSGWMFASTPALNALEHAVYDVWVITCRIEEPPPPASVETEPSETPATGPGGPNE